MLLDYDQIQANCSETPSMVDHLVKSSRHLGRINVLYTDGSVVANWGMSLDKATNPASWNP